jgi:Domain of unknown function (DUF4288)
MPWYAAHAIVSYRTIKPSKGEIDVYENVILISAKDGAEAHNKAQQFGEAYIVKDETLTTMEGEPLEESFVGIRKIIEISNPFSPGPDSAIPVDGAEITYSSFKVKDEQALADLVNGDEVLISYLE